MKKLIKLMSFNYLTKRGTYRFTKYPTNYGSPEHRSQAEEHCEYRRDKGTFFDNIVWPAVIGSGFAVYGTILGLILGGVPYKIAIVSAAFFAVGALIAISANLFANVMTYKVWSLKGQYGK